MAVTPKSTTAMPLLKKACSGAVPPVSLRLASGAAGIPPPARLLSTTGQPSGETRCGFRGQNGLILRTRKEDTYSRNESESSATSARAESPSAIQSRARLASNELPPVETNGSVSPVIGINPRLTPVLMAKCAAK